MRDYRGIRRQEIHSRNQRREDKAGGPDIRKAGFEGKQGVPNCPVVHSLENLAEQDNLDRFGIRSPANLAERDNLDRHLGIHSPANLAEQGNLDRLGIRSPANLGEQNNPDWPLGIHSPANGGQWDVPSGWDTRSRGDRSDPAAQLRPGTHSSGDQHMREHRNIPDTHSWAEGRLGIHSLGIRMADNRKTDTRNHKRGTRSTCPVAAEV